jgi:hypothetical protein
VQGVREASLEDLQNALGALTGRRIFEQLHAEEGAVETEAPSGPDRTPGALPFESSPSVPLHEVEREGPAIPQDPAAEGPSLSPRERDRG